MDTLAKDLRYAVRALLRRPTTAILAIVTLGLGIAASTGMFSVVDAVLLRPLPFPQPDRIVSVYPTNPSLRGHPTLGDAADRGTFSYPEFRDVRDAGDGVLESVAILGYGTVILDHDDGPAERVRIGATSAALFRDVMPVQPLLGRVFSESENEMPGRVLLTRDFWERSFGGDPSVVGSTLDLGGPTEVIGVLPGWFQVAGYEAVEAWAMMKPGENRGNHSFRAVARLAEGVTPDRAQAALTASLQAAAPPGEGHEHAIRVYPRLVDQTHTVRGPLLLLAVASGVLLLVACVSVAVLLLGTAIDRDQELAVRGALGAGRGRLIQQLLTESLVLAGAGALLGIALTSTVRDVLLGLAPAGVPRMAQATIDGRTLLFAVGVGLVCGMLFGLAPALLSSRRNLAASMTGSRGSTHAGRTRLQGVLVAAELALATVLLVGAGLLGRTVLALDGVDTGFALDRLLTVRVAVPLDRMLQGIEDPDALSAGAMATYDAILESVKAVPGVRDAAWTSVLPLSGDRGNNDIHPEGYEGDPIIAERRFVSGNYFDVTGIPILEGRAFTADDDRAGVAGTMIVSEGVARAVWPNESAVGKRVGYWGRETTVVGVAASVRDEGLGQGTEFAYYVPRRQADYASGSMMVRTEVEPASLVSAVREAVWSVDRGIAVPGIRPFREQFSAQLESQRFRARLVAFFSGLAALFALMGVYGVTARSVAARTREMGIRMALGAERGQVLGLVLRQAARLAVYGGVSGLVAGFLATRAIEGYLWGVQRTDALTLTGTALAVAAASIVAALAPGRRASRIAPTEALRAE